MKIMSARDAKNSFGLLLDQARAAPVQVEKHGRPVVVVMSIEEFQRLSDICGNSRQPGKRRRTVEGRN